MGLWWLILVVCSVLLFCAKEVHTSKTNGLGKEAGPGEKMTSTRTLYAPFTKLNAYRSFEDVKIYMIKVPAFISEMALKFQYYGRYSKSHNACNNTITVLLQHGSPAVPYRDEIISKSSSWIYNNSIDTVYEAVISLGNYKRKLVQSPLPGYWFVTTFLASTEKVKNIREQGLSKSDGNCLSAAVILQNLTWPVNAAQVIGKGQTVKSTIGIRQRGVKNYQYFVPDHSSFLIIKVENYKCLSATNCSLELGVSANSLPSNISKRCLPNDIDNCFIQVDWPQVDTIYYIELTGTNMSYEITADHTDCVYDDRQSCYPIIPLNLIRRVHLDNYWDMMFINNSRLSMFSLDIKPNYVGTTFVVNLTSLIQPYDVLYETCIRKDHPPIEMVRIGPLPAQYCSSSKDGRMSMKVLFPQPGKWFIGVRYALVEKRNSIILLTAGTQPCLDPLCSGHGHCHIATDVSISYGVCRCHYGYSGWTCAHYDGLDILGICLLTISNIAFVPGIIVAFKRKFYPEAIVYLFNMYCSTVYHACDSHGYCLYDYNTLQLSDFFASILSVWYTLMVMVKLSLFWHRTINIFALLCLFLGIQLSRFGVTMVAVPGGVGIAIVLASFAFRSRSRRKCFPSSRRWLKFLLPAGILAITGIVVYSTLETTANYKYLHSLWHICIALSVPFLLPSVRQPKLFVQYNMIDTLDDGEHFENSHDSLLLNPWEAKENETDQLDDEQLPKLVV